MDNTPKFQIKAKEDWEYIRNLPPEFQLSSEERIILPTYANEINKLDKLKKQLDAIGSKYDTALNLFDKSELQEKYRIQREKCRKQEERLWSFSNAPVMQNLISRAKKYELQQFKDKKSQRIKEIEENTKRNNAKNRIIAKRNREKLLGIEPEKPFMNENERYELNQYIKLLALANKSFEITESQSEPQQSKYYFTDELIKTQIEKHESSEPLKSFFIRYKGIHRTNWDTKRNRIVIQELEAFLNKDYDILFENEEREALEKAERTIERIQDGGLDLYRTIDVIDKDYDKSKSVIEESRYQEASTINKKLSKIAKILLIVFFILAIPTTFLVNSFLRHEVQGLHTTCYITETGECYHAPYCRYLYTSKKTNVYKAEKQGYRNCSQCRIGELDTSIKDEYFYAALIALGINLLLYIAVYIPTNKHHKKLISNINDTYSKKQKALLSEYSEKLKHLIYEIPIHLIVDAPEGTTFTNGLPNGDKYTVFLSENGKCYHSSRMCRGKWMNYSAHIFDLLNSRNPLSSCSNCLPPPYFGKPEWYVKYQHLHNLALKYGISFVGDETK